MMQNLLIGGFGFLGSQIARELVHHNEEVAIFDIVSPPPTAADFISKVSYVRGDISNWSQVMQAILSMRPENVICLPGIVPPLSEEDPALAYQINVQGTFNVLEAVRLVSVKCLLFPSSISVYEPGASPVVSNDFPQRPQSTYGTTKVCCERLGEQYYRRYGVNFRALRLPAILGAGRTGKAQSMFICYAISYAMQDIPYTLNVTPETKLTVIYIKDAVRAFLMLRDAPDENLRQRIYNVNGFTLSAAELVDTIRSHIPGAVFKYHPEENIVRVINGWPRRLEDSAAAADWGWKPEYDLRAAVADFIQELREHPEHYLKVA